MDKEIVHEVNELRIDSYDYWKTAPLKTEWQKISEYPLFTDAEVSGEMSIQKDNCPYEVLITNTLNTDNILLPRLLLRVYHFWQQPNNQRSNWNLLLPNKSLDTPPSDGLNVVLVTNKDKVGAKIAINGKWIGSGAQDLGSQKDFNAFGIEHDPQYKAIKTPSKSSIIHGIIHTILCKINVTIQPELQKM